jgi:predicted Zn-dependent protease
MFSRFRIASVLLLAASCSTPPAKPVSPVEQIAADTRRASGLVRDFRSKVRLLGAPDIRQYLERTASRISAVSTGLPLGTVEIMIHAEQSPEQARFFSFPGTAVSIPIGFLRKVEFENELAAAIAFELGGIIERHLANRLESLASTGMTGAIPLFGAESVFALNAGERIRSIRIGTRLLHFAGYDSRGMVSMLKRYPSFFRNAGSETPENEVNLELREALRAKSELLPALKPIVRSADFLRFKNELERIR